MNPDLQRHAGRYYGKYSGVVTDNVDDQNLGRIHVQIPAVLGPTTEVVARPCFPTAHFFVPAVGDSVWVEFEAGDPRYPIWVGVWYPSGSVPDTAAISPPENHVIKTPSGHTVEIMDKDGEEKITIRHKGNAFLSIDKNGSVLISNQNGSYVQLDADNQNATIVDENGNLITMSSDGITITEKSGSAAIQMTDSAVRLMAKSIILQAPSVSITGDPAAMPTVLATPDFMTMFNAFALHVHPTALGPSGPPTPPGPILTPGTNMSSGAVMK